MSQYGKPEYWDERYARFFITNNSEILNHLIGIKDTVVLKILLQQTLTKIIKF